MSLAAKIKQGWGYDVGHSSPDVVLSFTNGQYNIDHWPSANPPSITEIEAISLPAVTSVRKIAPYDLQARFTDAELVSIQTSVDPIVIRGRTKIQTITTFIDLNLPETQSLIGYLVTLGILTEPRATEILA